MSIIILELCRIDNNSKVLFGVDIIVVDVQKNGSVRGGYTCASFALHLNYFGS